MTLTAYQARCLARNASIVRARGEDGIFVVDAVSDDRRSLTLRRPSAPYGSTRSVSVGEIAFVSFAGDMIPIAEWRALH